jgi:hypothetical protein
MNSKLKHGPAPEESVMFGLFRSFLPNRNSPHSTKLACRLGVESLDERAVPAVITGPLLPSRVVTASQGANGVLNITGTAADDAISIGQKNGRIYVSGVNGSFNAASVSRIQINGNAGSDMIRLDGFGIAGATAVAKLSIVHGGTGNDYLFGGAGSDYLFGDDGNDIMFGNAGNDVLDGGAGSDQAFGGVGNDQLVADFADGTVAGNAGIDRVLFTSLDPAPLAQNNPALMQQAVQMGISNVSFSVSKLGGKLTVDHMNVTAVDITNGVTTLTIKARLKAKWGSGWLSASESGDIVFTVQPKVSASFTEAHLQSASIKLTNITVKSIHLDNVPGWMTNNSTVRDFLTSKFQGLPAIPATSQLQLFLSMGFSLGPTIVA